MPLTDKRLPAPPHVLGDAALAGLSGLTELDLSMEGLKEGTAAELLAAVAQLRQLHQLGLRPELAIPGADWLRLSALQHLTSLSLRWLAEEGAEGEEAATPLLALLAQLGCGRGGGGGRGGGLRQLSLEARTQDGETPVVPLHALSALEALTWVAPNLQVGGPGTCHQPPAACRLLCAGSRCWPMCGW